MSEFEYHSLVKFLSKPRYVRDVAEHFAVSPELVKYNLRKAVKSGDVLVSESSLPQMSPNPLGRRKPSKEFLYLSRNSPFLVGNVLKVKLQEVGKNSRSNTDVVSIKFVSKNKSLSEKKLQNHKERSIPSMCGETHLKSKKGWGPRFFDSLVCKMRLARQRVLKQRFGHKTLARYLSDGEPKSLSHAEKLRLLRALSEQPLPFLDIRRRFGVSKRTVMGFVKRALLKEEWGPRGIGVKYRLTEKGRSYLLKLETAGRFESQQKQNIFIRLKHRVFS